MARGYSLLALVCLILVLGGCDGRKSGGTGLDPGDAFSDPRVVALAKAAQGGNVAEIDRLVAAGVDVNSEGREGITPLFWAFIAQNKQGFQRLLEHNASPNIQTQHGDSVMSSVAEFATDSEWLKLALEHGGDPNCVLSNNRFRPKRTPLFDAINKHHVKGVKLLIDAGADLEHTNHEGETPLEFAVHFHHFDIVYELLVAGADYRARDSSGRDIASMIIEIEAEWGSSFWLEKAIRFMREEDAKRAQVEPETNR